MKNLAKQYLNGQRYGSEEGSTPKNTLPHLKKSADTVVNWAKKTAKAPGNWDNYEAHVGSLMFIMGVFDSAITLNYESEASAVDRTAKNPDHIKGWYLYDITFTVDGKKKVWQRYAPDESKAKKDMQKILDKEFLQEKTKIVSVKKSKDQKSAGFLQKDLKKIAHKLWKQGKKKEAHAVWKSASVCKQAAPKFSPADIKKMKDMTDRNDHLGRLSFSAKKLGLKKLEKLFDAVDMLQSHFGHAGPVMDARNELSKQLEYHASRKLTSEEYDEWYMTG